MLQSGTPFSRKDRSRYAGCKNLGLIHDAEEKEASVYDPLSKAYISLAAALALVVGAMFW